MVDDRGPVSVEGFLSARHQFAAAGDTGRLERLDEQLKAMAVSDPDKALAIMRTLGRSDDLGAKEAAVIYVKYLFPVRKEQATDLLVALLYDADEDIQIRALETLDIVTSRHWLTREEAAHLEPKK